jgi:hypothetical protein
MNDSNANDIDSNVRGRELRATLVHELARLMRFE